MCACSICSCVTSLIAALMPSLDRKTGTSTAVLTAVMLCSYQLFPGPCFLCGYDGTAILLYTGLDQVFIVYTCYNGGCAV